MPTIPLSHILEKKHAKYNLDDTSQEWLLYLKDHRKQILTNSNILYINGDMMGKYEFHLRWLLEDNNISVDLLWIILEINNIPTEINFTNIEKLYIPNIDFIIDLRKRYIQFQRLL